ncbi:hypothetical protein PsorP6_004838 [Peronosclerospora sorghi]|uniref:Uncharacterized protein n=1 Tax=Peronosclerospora sorghi TaxID=230839 RepID=A0ACC0VLB6_9STRA|nr:hypothetical protein PsorP6_004838 [Peronosclerospora sorghi]
MGDYRLYVVIFAVQQEEMDEVQSEREWNDNEARMSGTDNESKIPLFGVAVDVSDERRTLIPAEAFTETLDRRYSYLSKKPCGFQSNCHEKLVCKTHFLRFWNVSDKTIKNILKHVRKNRSMLPKLHGICGRRNAATSVEACTAVEEFLFETSRKYREAVDTQKYTRRKGDDGAIKTTWERDDIILLPSFFTRSGLFGAFKSGHNNAFDIYINTSKEIWGGNDVLAKLKIRNPAKDVCDECFIFCNKVAGTASMLEFEGFAATRRSTSAPTRRFGKSTKPIANKR